MKRLFLIPALIVTSAVSALSQDQKSPIIVENAPTIFNISYNPYYSYADQGQPTYINNSHFYNQSNTIYNHFPTGNGNYINPGNSNSLNSDLYRGEFIRSGIIYSGYVPVKTFGNVNMLGQEIR